MTRIICSESWKEADWKWYVKGLFRLQRRIFKAVLSGNLRKARKLQAISVNKCTCCLSLITPALRVGASLRLFASRDGTERRASVVAFPNRAWDDYSRKSPQNLLLRSKAAKWLAVRRVTQLNKGKNTAGVDGKKVLTPISRIRLVRELMKGWDNWDHQKLKALQIPKSNGKMRTLKIPTIADRAWQALLKFAIEPAHEATFHARSYGFRPGRGTHDAQQYVFLNLKGYPTRKDGPATKKIVLELDIAKYFDTISHKAIMDRVIAPPLLRSQKIIV